MTVGTTSSADSSIVGLIKSSSCLWVSAQWHGGSAARANSSFCRKVCTLVRVVLISFSTLPTMQKYLYYAGDELTKRGLDTWTVGSSTVRVPWSMGDQNIVVDTPVSPRPSISSLRSAKKSLERVLDLIEDVQPHVVHIVNKHSWNYLLIRRARRRNLKAKWVHTFHDPVGHHGDSIQNGVILYHRVVQRMLDSVVVHSKVAQTQALEVLRPPCPVVRVPLGVTPWKDYQEIDAADSKQVLVFGRLNKYKGCELFPQIFAEVYRLDPAVKITVAGQPSADLPDGLLRDIAACPNVTLNSEFIEEVAVDTYFRAAAFVLTPYTSMTQSGVLLDAFSNSRTVLAFEIEGMKEFLPTGATTVPAFNIGQYARQVVELANDFARSSRAGRDAWEFGKSRYTPKSMATSLFLTYRTLTEYNDFSGSNDA